MSNTENIKNILENTAPALEQAIAANELQARPEVPADYQLYATNCGLATAALQHYLLDTHGIATERLITHIDKPRGLNERRLGHVVLRSGDTIIDPTANQFMSFIGLTADRAKTDNLAHLYMPEKIWVFDASSARAVANAFAENAFSADRNNWIPAQPQEYGSTGALRGASLETLQDIYQSVWNPANYQALPVDPSDFRARHYNEAGRAVHQLSARS